MEFCSPSDSLTPSAADCSGPAGPVRETGFLKASKVFYDKIFLAMTAKTFFNACLTKLRKFLSVLYLILPVKNKTKDPTIMRIVPEDDDEK
jgi:hypothetical protein